MAATVTPTNLEWMPALLLVVGVVVMGVLLTISIRAKIALRQAQRPDPREAIERARAVRRASGDADEAMATLLETSQRLAAQLDSKAERLEQLLAEADERIARLDEPADARRAEPSGPPARSAPTGNGASGADPLTRSIYELADSGRDPVQIAQALDEQVGKVELILALRASA